MLFWIILLFYVKPLFMIVHDGAKAPNLSITLIAILAYFFFDPADDFERGIQIAIIAPVVILWLRLIYLIVYTNEKYGVIAGLKKSFRVFLDIVFEIVAFGAIALIIKILLLGFVDLDMDMDMDFDGGSFEDSLDLNAENLDTSSTENNLSDPSTEEVSGYTKANGTQVEGYTRTVADGVEWNNFSSKS